MECEVASTGAGIFISLAYFNFDDAENSLHQGDV
jgi:hypothetical protein